MEPKYPKCLLGSCSIISFLLPGASPFRNDSYMYIHCLDIADIVTISFLSRFNQILNLDEKDIVTISYNIRGSRWQKDNIVKYYTKLVGWKVSESNEVSNAEYLPDRETDF